MNTTNTDVSSSTQIDAQSQFTAQLLEALALQTLQQQETSHSHLGKELTQALANHLTAQLGHSNAELLAAKGKVLETMALLEKAQQHAAKLNGGGNTSAQISPQAPASVSSSRSYAQPIKVNTHHISAGGLGGSSGWSGPSTPSSSTADSNHSNVGGYDNHVAAKALNAQLKLLQQHKGLMPPGQPMQHHRAQSPVPGYNIPGHVLPTHAPSPVPGYNKQQQITGYPRNNGFRHPFMQQQKPGESYHGGDAVNAPSYSAQHGSAMDGVRHPHANMTTPDPHGFDRNSIPPHLKDLPFPLRYD